MVSVRPSSVRVRAYQVGFGDCLLLTVTYPKPLPDGRAERHVLVDFGTKVLADGGPKLDQVAEKIAEHCGGHLDVVVATHRHQDHISGFGNTRSREHLAPLEPSLIIRPWTDGPAADGADTPSQQFLALLALVEGHNARVAESFGLDSSLVAKRIAALAALGVGNVPALAMLEEWTRPERTMFVRAGDQVDVDTLLPGVGIRVLGPPTLDQAPNPKSYASSSSEYWLAMTNPDQITPELARVDPDDVWAAKELVAPPDGLGAAAFLVDKMHKAGAHQVLSIVEGFDDVLNNTSVVLLVTVGARNVLLAGDAQVESWRHPLDTAPSDPDLLAALTSVDLYKVGHHGSRNATPRRLVDLWSAHPAANGFCSVLSTRSNVYGTTAEGTVPKPELVKALKGLGPVYSTEDLPKGVWWLDVTAATTAGATWSFANGPGQT